MIDTTNPVDRTGNHFCGPLVLAAIMGTSTGQVSESIAEMRQATRGVLRFANGKVKRVRNRTTDKIRGTYDAELFELLERNGYSHELVDVGARYRQEFRNTYVNDAGTRFCRPNPPILSAETWWPWTTVKRECLPLWRWLLRVRDDGQTYIVHTPGHWAITARGMWCETYTDGTWVRAAQAPKGNRKVVDAWRITRQEVLTHGN